MFIDIMLLCDPVLDLTSGAICSSREKFRRVCPIHAKASAVKRLRSNGPRRKLPDWYREVGFGEAKSRRLFSSPPSPFVDNFRLADHPPGTHPAACCIVINFRLSALTTVALTCQRRPPNMATLSSGAHCDR